MNIVYNSFLSSGVTCIGVELAKAKLLEEELDIKNCGDLLRYYPFRYEDRSNTYTISELSVSVSPTVVQLEGYIQNVQKIDKGKKKLIARFEDGTGKLDLIWFYNFFWLHKLKPHVRYRVWGKLVILPNGQKQLVHPEITLATHQIDCWMPIYHSTERLRKNQLDTKGIALLQRKLLNQLHQMGTLEETLPIYLLAQYQLLSLKEALQHIHFPANKSMLNQARRRLKFEELFYIQLKFFKLKQVNVEKKDSKSFRDLSLFNTFYHNHLPFNLTEDQKKVIKDIYRDLGSGKQMNRLLQGDVGSGKTIVAFLVALIVMGSQAQVAIMAPTEILAKQHYDRFCLLAQQMGAPIALLTGSTKKKEKTHILYRLRTGLISIVVGTHALLSETVFFKELGLSVIDEQHRFGVAQRAGLLSKNPVYLPHMLIMTATPIPRSLAMTFYGDLNLSTIYTLPAGRKAVKTEHYYEHARLRVFQFIREQLTLGKQVYIVYPLIEASETLDYKNLLAGYEGVLQSFPDIPTGMVHGKMDGIARDIVMKSFQENKIRILVTTTVIEVGVHIPNATVMLIESAERFGLSQLHQLRGRVGRSSEQSFCILMTSYRLNKVGKARIETMLKTNSGFKIAELDLKLRGPGDLMGLQQSGTLRLTIADLSTDTNILEAAHVSAKAIMQQDPNFQQLPHLPICKEYARLQNASGGWNRIG